MRNTFIFAILLLASFSSFAEEFQTVSLSDALHPLYTKASKDNKLPLTFKVPSIYEKRNAQEQQTILWGTKADIDKVISTKSLKNSENGIFTLKISLNAGYDEKSKKFSGEDKLANVENLPGFTDVTYSRYDSHGIPMATLTALSGNQHLFLQYIAVGNAALLINYYPAEMYSEKDSETWAQFINGLNETN